ncbi:MAG: glycogen-binding domain-containing protein [Saprospiraceae bacterium]|nr:glycogen-binding domain-containing protein [Candidatus Defluviibacterium haderslevense]
MSLLLFFIVNLLLQNIYAQKLNSVGLLKPIKLDTGWNKILLDQYFENVNLISDVHADSTLEVQFIADSGQLLIKSKIHHGPYGTIEFNYKGDAICWIFIHPIKQSITLSLNNNNYTTVVIKGQMNAWKSQELTLENGQWSYHTMLNPGRYQYLFVADGKEMLDPLNLKTAPNGSGGVNSLLEVETSKENIQLIPSITSDQKLYINTSQIAGQSIVLWNNKNYPIGKVESISCVEFLMKQNY